MPAVIRSVTCCQSCRHVLSCAVCTEVVGLNSGRSCGGGAALLAGPLAASGGEGYEILRGWLPTAALHALDYPSPGGAAQDEVVVPQPEREDAAAAAEAKRLGDEAFRAGAHDVRCLRVCGRDGRKGGGASACTGLVWERPARWRCLCGCAGPRGTTKLTGPLLVGPPLLRCLSTPGCAPKAGSSQALPERVQCAVHHSQPSHPPGEGQSRWSVQLCLL